MVRLIANILLPQSLMKKETEWNESSGNRPDASGSAGASTAVDSLRSPGSFSSTSSDYGRHADADQVGVLLTHTPLSLSLSLFPY